METEKPNRAQPEPPGYGKLVLQLGEKKAAAVRFFKSQYGLESWGFTTKQARELIFFKWLVEKRGLNEQESRSSW